MKSQKRGNTGLCFEVASETDRLRTEACAETEIAVPCIGFDIEGPTTANVGEVVDLSLNVKNECDEPLEDIQLTIRYDQGLVFPGHSNPAAFRFSELQFGESAHSHFSSMSKRLGHVVLKLRFRPKAATLHWRGVVSRLAKELGAAPVPVRVRKTIRDWS